MEMEDWVLVGILVIPAIGYIAVNDCFADPLTWLIAVLVVGGMLVAFLGGRHSTEKRTAPVVWVGIVALIAGVILEAVVVPY